MTNKLTFLLLTIMCCLLITEQTKAAGVTCITQVSYYEPTGSLWVSAETLPDYDTLAYHAIGHWGYVNKDDVELTEFNGESYDSEVDWGDFFPYDANANYAIEVFPELVSKHNYPIGDSYEDYYDYIEWSSGYYGSFPAYYSFSGPGPEVSISLPEIVLGSVLGIFTQGAMSGTADHLRVIHDDDVTRSDLCGQVQKLIKYQVVDQNNRAVGDVQIDEKPQTIVDSCSGTTVTLSRCNTSSADRYGNFTDGVKTGCPYNGPGTCGYDFFNRWRHCISTPYTPETYKELAYMYYWATHTFVKIDGQTDMDDNTYKYPEHNP